MADRRAARASDVGLIDAPGGLVVDPPPEEAPRLVGREAERDLIVQLLHEARDSVSGVLVLRGEAGTGKSALLHLARSCAAGMQVLRVVGVEPESELAFAALHRLLRPVLSSIDRIPDVQAQALRAAMGTAPAAAENRFVIALGVLSLLAEVAVEGPLLCLVDDAQWLDQPSADALAFVARRLEAEGIVMLFADRERDPRSFPGVGLPERRIVGLDPVASDRLLVARFGTSLGNEVRREIVASAKGNPLALLEIPAALTPGQLAGRETLPRPMPIGHHLEEILLSRVHRLPPPAQMLLLVAAAEGSGDADIVLAAANVLGVPASALTDAETSGLLRTESGALVFHHPVLRTAIYENAGVPQRKAAHRALADVLVGEINSDRRAWHRAALVLYPDDEIADELERTAGRARDRGGHSAAHRALRRAAELTSSDERRTRRLAAAARAAWDAGRPDEAIAMLRAAEAETEPATFAELRHVQGAIEFDCGVPLEGARVLMEGAERVAELDPRKALQMLFDAAQSSNYAGDVPTMLEAASRAGGLSLDESEPEAALAEVLAGVVQMLRSGDPESAARLPEALDRVADTTDPRWLIWAGAAAALIGDQARDDALRRRAEGIARRTMAVGNLSMVLGRMAWSDLRYGRVPDASIHAEEGLTLAVETGLTNPACFHRAILAWVAAVRGDEASCTSLAEQASATAIRQGLAPHNALAVWAVGLMNLGLGRWEEATTRLESMWSGPPGTTHPYVARRALPDLVEAAVRAGRFEAAGSAAVQLAEMAGANAPAHEMAVAARVSALTTPDPQSREKLLSEALVFHDRDPHLFERSRTLLLLGEHLRRERRRREARAPLHSALVVFEQLGAVPWLERTRRELRATGQTVRRRDHRAATELTLQERQVAALVAEGATNKEVAGELFLSPRTVEYHLRNVFLKLGISSRAELVRRGRDAT